MAENYSWQTVPSRTNKKNQSNGGAKSKKKDDTSSSSIPKFSAPAAPVFSENSSFGALDPASRKKPAKAPEIKANGDSVAKSAIPRPQKKESSKKPAAQKQTLEKLIPTVNGAMFEEIYIRSKELFKDSPLMWLKELTGALNTHLHSVQQADHTFHGNPEDYPSNLLKADVRKLFQKSISECSSDLLKVFIDQLIQSVMTDIAKGLPVHGYQIVAQLVARHRHDLFTANLPKYRELIVTNRSSPAKCLTVMWILGQCGSFNFRSGLKVWTQLMLWVLGIKSLANYAVSYLEQILKKARNDNNKNDGYGVIGMEEYFMVLDGVYSSSNALQPSLQNKLKGFYPVLKEFAFGKEPKKVLAKYFPSFLTRLTMDSINPQLQSEALSNCMLCLREDSQSLRVWVEIYDKHLPQSSALLNHLADTWTEKNTRAIDSKVLQETLNRFIAVTETFNKAKPGRDACLTACQRFDDLYTARAQESASKAKTIIFLCLLLAVGLVAFDFYHNNGYQASKTHKLLMDMGVDGHVELMCSKIKAYTTSASKYLSKNLPKWTEKVVVYVEPAAEKAWQLSVSALQYIHKVSEPLRVWLSENVPVFVDWVVMHPIWNTLHRYSMDIWKVIGPYVMPVYDNVIYFYDKALLTVSTLIFS